MYKLEFNLQREDFIQYNIHYASQSKTYKQIMMFIRFLGPLGFMGTFYFFGERTSFYLMMFLAMSVLWVFGAPKFTASVMEKRIRTLLNADNVGELTSHRQIELNKKGVKEIIDQTMTEHVWTDIKKVSIGKYAAYLQLDEVSAIILPARVLNEKPMKFIQEKVKAN